MSRPRAEDPAAADSGNSGDPGPTGLASLLALLADEICRPLDELRGGVGRLVDDPDRSLTEAERGEARTILGLCDDLDRLTRECIGLPG